MFNRKRFAEILQEINKRYESQRDFSKKSSINRTYLSKYMNEKLEDPPKPQTLQKIADASFHLISYSELMHICGYVGQTIELDEIDIAFASGIRGLNKENQEIAKNIIECLLAKQKEEENQKRHS